MSWDITFDHVSKSFNEESALKDISFKINKGEFISLLGPSGCGKTTILRLINRLIKSDDGSIIVGDTDVATCTESEIVDLRRSMGYVIQSIGLMPHWTIERNLLTSFEISSDNSYTSPAFTNSLLKLVNLPKSVLAKYPRQLSGGQQQRIGIARALARRPNVILMDEPFGALDTITRSELQNELLKIKSECKCTIVFVTHDIDEAFKLSDKIILMSKGHIEQYGTPNELVMHPATPFVKDFLKKVMPSKSISSYGSEIVTINRNAWRVDANNLMNHKGVTKLALVDDNEKFVGLITKNSLAKYLKDDSIKMESLENASIHDYLTIKSSQSRKDLVNLINNNKGRRSIIILKDNQPIRIIDMDQQREILNG